MVCALFKRELAFKYFIFYLMDYAETVQISIADLDFQLSLTRFLKSAEAIEVRIDHLEEQPYLTATQPFDRDALFEVDSVFGAISMNRLTIFEAESLQCMQLCQVRGARECGSIQRLDRITRRNGNTHHSAIGFDIELQRFSGQ